MKTAALSGQVALVTGAGSEQGIGFATARLLVRAGAAVVLTATTDRIRSRVEELEAEGGEVMAEVADLTREGEVQRLVEHAGRWKGRLDICINNAGMIQSGGQLVDLPVEAYELKTWEESLRRNLTSAYLVTRAVLPMMRNRKYGRIVNVASASGPVQAFAGDIGYHAAKAGMIGLTKAVALETAKEGITVNAVAPGWIATGSQTPVEAEAGKRTPIGRSGTPEEVAAVLAWLATPAASYVTGQMFVVDGGSSLQEA